MLIDQKDLEAAIAKANEINDVYNSQYSAGGNPEKSVDFLLEICSRYLGKTFEIQEVEVHFEGSAVYSMCVMSANHVEIVIAKGLNHCWKRYTVCKELFHVLIDTEDCRNLDLAALTEAVSFTFPNDEAHATKSVSAEFLAEVAAMEFLFPYASRERHYDSAHANANANGGGLNFKDIAVMHRIPQRYVDQYLTDQLLHKLAPMSRQLPK